MDPEEPFNPEYYRFVLQSLTLNSRAIITELTTIAERFPEYAEEIVNLIEERIKKSLPQHKLFAIYLLDSICKNIGNPYNLLFGTNLYKVFTESYLVVTDTPTRQDLINLFKTWHGAKTTAGSDLFPSHVVLKIEQFIIKATSIQQSQNQYHANTAIINPNGVNIHPHPIVGGAVGGGGVVVGGGSAGGIPTNFQQVSFVPPDALLRESNTQLQLIIKLNTEFDKYIKETSNHKPNKKIQQNIAIFEKNEQKRNNIVSGLNYISESILTGNKKFYETNFNQYQKNLVDSRKKLEEQLLIQKKILIDFENDKEIEIDKNVKHELFTNWTFDISEDEQVIEILAGWGVPNKIISTHDTNKIKPDTDMHKQPIEEKTDIDDELYDPGMNFESDSEEKDKPEPVMSFLFNDDNKQLTSNLKKRKLQGLDKPKKRVRFVDNV